MERLNGKIALVTGAAQGIGAGIARLFAAEGATVVLADKDREGAERVASSLRETGGAAHAVCADVSVTEDVRRMVQATVEQFSGLDILVNNAALTSFGRRLEADDMEARYDRLMATNVKSVWMALRSALPHLKARGGGSVINIASVHGLASSIHNSAYAASKGALIAGTHALAVELAPDNIRVNCISPGMIWKDAPGDWLRREIGPELYAEFEQQFGDHFAVSRTRVQPLPVEGRPEDIAYCAVYLASDEARFCTGANFVIDGGATALLASPAAEFREQEKEVWAWVDDAKRRRAGQPGEDTE
jgi:3-oxoacyl-[acyl-carrier protein] reductase